MRRTSLALLCASAVLFAVGVCWPGTLWASKENAASMAGGDHQKGRGNGGKHARDSEAVAVERHDAWTDHDHCRVVVREYYDRGSLPPGLAKKRSLPPGLRKQLKERGHLPPGLEKHMVVLPVQLERRLPPLPPQYVWRAAGDDLLVIDFRANLVVSVMAGVFVR